jgi:hypothetical protein
MSAMRRRQFLKSAAGSCLVGALHPAEGQVQPPRKAPFLLLYSNDLTNTLSCVSPFHKARQPFRKEMLEATIDEVAGTGVDVHLLQPGLGVVPLWKSNVQPLEEHAAWLKERYGQKLDQYTQAVVNGTDLIQTFLDRCRLRGQAPFISIRMNDAHHKENVDKQKGEKTGSISMSINRFYHEHPEYRLLPGSLSGKDLVLNWAVPEVRAQKFALLQELCENYDLDGLELDFLRTYSYFRLAETTREQRAGIMSTFVKDVRAMLDRTARDGRRRWLSVRVPCYTDAFDPLGIDLPAFTAAGVDMVNASSHYFTTQQHHLAAMRKQAPDASLYFELCHTIWKGEKVAVGYDVFPYRRATREHLRTAAHLAYARGADGISLFNFAYYRENGTGEGRGVFGEPPFDALKSLREPKELAQEPQHWFIAQGWRAPGAKPLPLPRKLVPNTPARFNFDLAAPAGGWKGEGRLRIQCNRPITGIEWTATFNGRPLLSTLDVSEPFPVPYPSMMGKPDELRAWLVPATLLTEGINRLELSHQGSGEASMSFIDLALPQGNDQ